jgi:hypothetical protein
MKELQALLNDIAAQGRNGDTMLAHINPQEANLLKSLGGSGTINPKTGLPEFWGWKSITNAVSDIGSSIDDTIVSPVVDTVKDVGSAIDDEILRPVNDELAGLDDFVNENVPGGWAGVILIAAGVYYAPEIGAYFSSTGEVMTAEQAAAATAEAGTAEAGASMTAAEANAAITAEQAGAMTAAEANAAIAAEQSAAAAAASATPAQAAAAKAAGMTLIDYAKAGLLVNALTGDPLGLSGGTGGGGGGGGGSTGFAQVDIPVEWKSPTYAAPSAPIDLSSIFSNQNMLGGTQWQNLPSQQPNVSFNDIFASGQQQTPMGTPVDINQIVSAILGQAATSQKSA